jgi:hypothetical protein
VPVKNPVQFPIRKRKHCYIHKKQNHLQASFCVGVSQKGHFKFEDFVAKTSLVRKVFMVAGR